MGFAIIDKLDSGYEKKESGVFRFNTKVDFLPRLQEVYEKVYALSEKWNPDVLAIEAVFKGKNVASLVKLAQARGVAIAACQQAAQCEVVEYSPTQIKNTVAGYGRGGKEALKKMIGVSAADAVTFDESDAQAIALCHYFYGEGFDNGQKKGYFRSNSLKNSLKGVDP